MDGVKERVVFDYTMESLLRMLETPLPPEQSAELARLGVELSRPLLPAYPLETYVAIMDFIARTRWPHLSQDEACFELGRGFMRAYRQTLIGKAIYSLSKFIGPHRALERMSRNFRSANNFTQTELRKVGPAAYELKFNHASRTGYFRGLLTEALEKAGASGLSVKLLARDGAEATFLITWRE